MGKMNVVSRGAIALGLVLVVQVIMVRCEGGWESYEVGPPTEFKIAYKIPPKLPRPDDLKLDPDGQVIYNPEVYQLVNQNVSRKNRMTIQLRIKQRTAPDGTKYQVALNDKSPDAKFGTETKYFQLPYTPPKLPGPNDLNIGSNGQISYNPIVYQMLNFTIDQNNLATIALKIKVQKDPKGSEYQVYLDDDDPGTYEKIVYRQLQFPNKPPPKLPRPDDLKLHPDGQVIYNPEVYQLLHQNISRKNRVTIQLRIKQRTAPDGTNYQVFLNDKSPDAKFETEIKYLQLPYTPPKLSGPDDLKIDSNGQIRFNPIVYQLLNYTIDEKNLATIALKIKVQKHPNGTEYQVHLDDDDPDAFEKIVYRQLQFLNKAPPKLPRPDDLKLNPDGQVIYNPEVYQLVYQNVSRTNRVTIQLRIKQRTAPDGTKYQVFLNDNSPDAKFETETKYLQLPYTPPKLPGPEDLKIDSNGQISYNPIVYQMINYTVDEKNLATVALKIKLKKHPNGTEHHVHLDDDDPDSFEKIVYRQLQFPNKPPPKLPRPDDLKLLPDGKVIYNPEVYQLVYQNVSRTNRVTIQLRIKQRTAPDGTKYQVFLNDNSTDAKFETETKYLQLPYTPPKLPGPDDLKIDSNGQISYNPIVYKLLNYTIDEKNLATIAIKIKLKRHPNGTEYQVHLDDDDPDTFEKIIYRPLQFPYKPPTPTYNITSYTITPKITVGSADSNSTNSFGTKPTERDGNCGNLPKNSTIYNPTLLNVPSYKQENSSTNPDGSRTIYGCIRVWSPVVDGPKYVVQYYPRPADSEKLQAKITVDKDGNCKIVKVCYLNQPDGGTSTNSPRVEPGGKSPPDFSANQKLENELLIFNKIWYNIQSANKPSQPANVSMNVKLNPDGTRTVVPYTSKPSPGCTIWTGFVVPGPNRTESVQLKPGPENNWKVTASNNSKIEKPDTTGSSVQQPPNPKGQGLDRNERPTTPNLYNIPSFKELYSSTAPDGSRILHVHIRVYQPIADGPWYTVHLNSKLPNSEKLRAKIIIERDGTAMIRQIWCLPQDHAVREICKMTSDNSVTTSETSARKPTIDLSIQNKPWFQFLTNKTNPNEPTNKRVIVWLKTAENPNSTYVVLPLDTSTPRAVLQVGCLEERTKNQLTFAWETVTSGKTVSTQISSLNQTTFPGSSQGSKKDSSEEETTRKSQRETYEYPDETATGSTTTRDLYFYTDEDQPSSPRPLRKTTRTPDQYVYPDESQTNSPGLFRTTSKDVYVYNDENQQKSSSPFRTKLKDTYVYEDQA